MADPVVLTRLLMGGLTAGSVIAGVYLRAKDSPRDLYFEDVQVLQENRIDHVCKVLAEVVIDVLDNSNGNEELPVISGTTDEEDAAIAIRKTLEDQMDETIEEGVESELFDLKEKMSARLLQMEKPAHLYERCRKSRSAVFRYLLAVILFSVFANLLHYLKPYLQETIEIGGIIISYLVGVLITIAVLGIVFVIKRLWEWQSAADELEKMLEEDGLRKR